jgi:hypothetical protein
MGKCPALTKGMLRLVVGSIVCWQSHFQGDVILPTIANHDDLMSGKDSHTGSTRDIPQSDTFILLLALMQRLESVELSFES